jgi:hypothetical protein
MGRTTRAVGWVSVRRAHQVSIKRFSATDSVVEVVDLEPERDAVPVRSRQRIADPAVVMLEVEVMQSCRTSLPSRTRRSYSSPPCPLSQPRSTWYQRPLRGTSVTEIRGCGRIALMLARQRARIPDAASDPPFELAFRPQSVSVNQQPALHHTTTHLESACVRLRE